MLSGRLLHSKIYDPKPREKSVLKRRWVSAGVDTPGGSLTLAAHGKWKEKSREVEVDRPWWAGGDAVTRVEAMANGDFAHYLTDCPHTLPGVNPADGLHGNWNLWLSGTWNLSS